METRFLLPNKCKNFGWIIFIPSLILGLLKIIFIDFELKFLEIKMFTVFSGSFIPWSGPVVLFGFDKVNITGTIIGILFLLGSVMVAFSKEKEFFR